MINHWFFRCKDISKLVSRSYDEKLPLLTRLGIRLHLKICLLCNRYKGQLDLIQKAMQHLQASPDDPPQKKMPQDAKTRLKELIR